MRGSAKARQRRALDGLGAGRLIKRYPRATHSFSDTIGCGGVEVTVEDDGMEDRIGEVEVL